MKSLTEEVSNVISRELALQTEEQKVKNFEKLVSDMKSAGLIKPPSYTLPLVDTIGKTYYTSFNKHK